MTTLNNTINNTNTFTSNNFVTLTFNRGLTIDGIFYKEVEFRPWNEDDKADCEMQSILFKEINNIAGSAINVTPADVVKMAKAIVIFNDRVKSIKLKRADFGPNGFKVSDQLSGIKKYIPTIMLLAPKKFKEFKKELLNSYLNKGLEYEAAIRAAKNKSIAVTEEGIKAFKEIALVAKDVKSLNYYVLTGLKNAHGDQDLHGLRYYLTSDIDKLNKYIEDSSNPDEDIEEIIYYILNTIYLPYNWTRGDIGTKTEIKETILEKITFKDYKKEETSLCEEITSKKFQENCKAFLIENIDSLIDVLNNHNWENDPGYHTPEGEKEYDKLPTRLAQENWAYEPEYDLYSEENAEREASLDRFYLNHFNESEEMAFRLRRLFNIDQQIIHLLKGIKGITENDILGFLYYSNRELADQYLESQALRRQLLSEEFYELSEKEKYVRTWKLLSKFYSRGTAELQQVIDTINKLYEGGESTSFIKSINFNAFGKAYTASPAVTKAFFEGTSVGTKFGVYTYKDNEVILEEAASKMNPDVIKEIYDIISNSSISEIKEDDEEEELELYF